MAGGQGARMIEIRPLTPSASDLKPSVRLQRQIWGFEDVDLIPLRLFVVATKIGGQVYGAFDGEQHDRLLHGDSRPQARRQDLSAQPHAGRAAGISQRRRGPHAEAGAARRCAARGIDLIEWTFDPLEIKNAFFNMERLGAIVRRYVLNQYGTTSSPLHGGLPTDRCIAEWWIASPRVKAILAGERFEA